MKTYYQSGSLLKSAEISLVDFVEMSELIISKSKIQMPYAILGFNNNINIALYAPSLCEVASCFKNGLERDFHDKRIDAFKTLDNDVRISSCGMLVSDTLELDSGFMILNPKEHCLKFSEIVLQDEFLNKKSIDYELSSGLDEWIIDEVLDEHCGFTPSNELLNRLWDFVNDESVLSQEIKNSLSSCDDEIDFREGGKLLRVLNQKHKNALIFEISDYLNGKGVL